MIPTFIKYLTYTTPGQGDANETLNRLLLKAQ